MSYGYYRRKHRKKVRKFFYVDPMSRVREILEDKTLHLKAPATLEELANHVKTKERALLSAISRKNQQRQELEAISRQLKTLQAERDKLSAKAGILGRLLNLGPEANALKLTKAQIAELEAKAAQLISQIEWNGSWLKPLGEEIQHVTAAIEKVDKARMQADALYRDRQKRRAELERTRAERQKQSAERKAAALKRKHEQEKAEKAEWQRLRGIAASVNDKSRERAETLREPLKKQFRVFPRCPYCFDDLEEDAELDHIIPIARGGLSTDENLVFVCRPCNQAKAEKTLAMFLREMGYDRDRTEDALEKLGKHF